MDVLAEIKRNNVDLRGVSVVVEPIKMRQLQALSKAVEPFFTDLQRVLSGDDAQLLQLINQHYDAILEAVTVATACDRETLQELMPDDFVKLMSAVIEANTDFFIRHLLPQVKSGMAGIQQQIAQITAQQPSA